MTKARPIKSDRDRMIDAGMDALALGGFATLRSGTFLIDLGLERQHLRREFGDVYGLIVAALRRLNGDMLDAGSHLEADDTLRDRLFEVLMTRFDAAGPWRDAIGTILRQAPRDPLLGLALLRAGDEAMSTALEAAGMDADGPMGRLRAGVLASLVYLPALRTWLDDDTEDFAKTMRALDKGLGRVERLGNRLERGNQRPAQAADDRASAEPGPGESATPANPTNTPDGSTVH